MARWRKSFEAGKALLAERATAMELALDNDSIALVELLESTDEFGVDNQRAVYVQWTSAEDMAGRLAHLDRKERLTFSTSILHSLRSFVGCTIIHPRTGLVKDKQGPRQRVPDHIAKLQEMWTTACDAGTIALAGAGSDVCVMCRNVTSADVPTYERRKCVCALWCGTSAALHERAR